MAPRRLSDHVQPPYKGEIVTAGCIVSVKPSRAIRGSLETKYNIMGKITKNKVFLVILTQNSFTEVQLLKTTSPVVVGMIARVTLQPHRI